MKNHQKQSSQKYWQKYFFPQKPMVLFSDIQQNYSDGISMYYPRFRLVQDFLFETSADPVFFDEEESGYHGLGKCQLWFDHQKKPIYLVDNHHEVLYPFLECKESASHIFDIVHIDAHRDDAVFPGHVSRSISLETISYEISRCRVSDYLDFATRSGIIGKVHSITQSFEFESFRIPKKPYILNLDLDIFGEEGSCVPLEQKVEVIAKAWMNAQAICMATSPGFIDQEDTFFLARMFSGTV